MFIALEGFPGSGKSTLMASMVLEDIAKGKPVCCNREMSHGDHVPGFGELLKWCAHHRNGTVYIEEAGVFLSRRVRDFPDELLYLGFQARHLGIDFVMNFQHRAQIEPDMLRLCSVIYRCKKLFSGFPTNGLKNGGYILNPVFRFIAYEPGELLPLWGATPVLDWKIWRAKHAAVFARKLVSKSVHTDRQIASASFELRQQDMTGQRINLR